MRIFFLCQKMQHFTDQRSLVPGRCFTNFNVCFHAYYQLRLIKIKIRAREVVKSTKSEVYWRWQYKYSIRYTYEHKMILVNLVKRSWWRFPLYCSVTTDPPSLSYLLLIELENKGNVCYWLFLILILGQVSLSEDQNSPTGLKSSARTRITKNKPLPFQK